ncbi:carbohydrate porin [Photobacterium sp. SDRW27]|uniref:carbohydrate porin n=1 Tax=Photobacterium obscurum TaxID=2829490 RepID=UPI0022437576|nr:carbohydrate porin [Photobacterium obscurum]MCW8329167.1 carbohydrate porin [Photobacterium obscurum]
MKLSNLTLACLLATSTLSVSHFANAETDDFAFTGYARYGMHYADNGNDYVSADGQLAGNAAGRLGNETNGGEFQFSKGFDGANGTKWDIVLMMENWWKQDGEYGDIALKKFYAGAYNVFASQPDAYIWAGRDFHQRPQQGLNDYFFMTHDGQGGGIKNLDLGGAKLNVAFVAQTAGEGTGDNGDYALTTKLHDIRLADSISMDIFANYGLSSDKSVDADKDGAFQVGTIFNFNGNKLSLRYADNTDNSVFNKTDDLTTLYASFEGTSSLSDRTAIEYQAAYHDYDSADDAVDRSNYSVIVRPTHSWNDIHSTWLEAGYSLVDYDNADENSAWKVTLSQNISIGKNTWDRPMLRFYATVGDADNKVAGDGSANTGDTTRDTFAVGAMWEAWW